MNSGPTRRGFLKGAVMAAGIVGASRLTGLGALRSARAADPVGPAPALFVLYLRGGYNALFPSADSFLGAGTFGVTSDNILRLGTSDVYVDKGTLGALPQLARQHLASIGVRHGLSAHPAAQRALFMDGEQSYLIQLSRALGGTAAVRCVAIGGNLPPGVHRAIGDVSLQQVRDLSTTIAALGGATSPGAPERGLAASGLAAAEAMSSARLGANPASGASLIEGYPAAVGLLGGDAIALDYGELAGAYGVTAGAGGLPTVVQNSRMQILGAELMIRAGANLVIATSPKWDSHDDVDGSAVRRKMKDSGITAALGTFLSRTMAMTDRNVVTLILGDFSRSLPGSDHQANLTATVIGNNVRRGTTGRVNRNVGLPVGTPGIPGMWAYLSAALAAPERPFGANPHGLVIA